MAKGLCPPQVPPFLLAAGANFFFWFFKCSIMAPKSLCSKPARPARPRRKRGATMLIVMAIALTIALTHGSDPPNDATQRVYLTARARSCETRSHNQLTQKPFPASPKTANNLCPHNMSPTIRTPTYDTHHTIPLMCQSRTAHTTAPSRRCDCSRPKSLPASGGQSCYGPL